MILTGREMQALLGATMIQAHVPFVGVTKPILSAEDQKVLDAADAKLRTARQCLVPSIPRETPGWLELMLNGETDVILTTEEAHMLAMVAGVCLAELKTDGDLSAFVGPGVGLAALRTAHGKVVEL